jgi:preprotein translocase subunit SecG
MSHIWTDVFSILFALVSVFLIFIILLQRGRGGGLAGAFGATGGQSAFGTKAGDVFTRITIGVAVVWVALAGITGYAMTVESKDRFRPVATDQPDVVPTVPPKGAGGNVNPFEAGDQGAKNAPATKETTPAKGSSQPASTKTPASVTPPAKTTPPASDATKQPAPTK